MVEISINFENILRSTDNKKNITIKSIACKPAKISCLVIMKCNLFELYNFIVVKFCRSRRSKSHFDNSEKKIIEKLETPP